MFSRSTDASVKITLSYGIADRGLVCHTIATLFISSTDIFRNFEIIYFTAIINLNYSKKNLINIKLHSLCHI